MNNFAYKQTAIIASEFDFSRIEKDLKFSGDVCLSTTIAIPKDPDKNKTVILSLDLSMGTKEDKIQMHVQSRSFFEIEGNVVPDTLRQDAQELCYPKASAVLSEKIAELTHIHIGKAMKIAIPSKF